VADLGRVETKRRRIFEGGVIVSQIIPYFRRKVEAAMSDENKIMGYMRLQDGGGTGYSSLGRSNLDLISESEVLTFLVKALVSKAAQMVSQEIGLNSIELASIADPFSRVEVVKAQIVEITKEKVSLRCLIDSDEKRYQIRNFDREPFEGVVPMEVGTFVEISIYTKPGERKFIYKHIDGESIEKLFEPENLFEEFIDSPMFKPLPSVSEDQL
jgi:hypothetical protein